MGTLRSTSKIPLMDTERLLEIAQEYSEHEYAPYAGGATLLAEARWSGFMPRI